MAERSPPTLFTIGHSSRTEAGFERVLTRWRVDRIVDVRSWPSSGRYPHFARDSLATWLPRIGVSYVWERALGGKRKVTPDADVHSAIDQPMFRAYVEHLNGEAAGAAIERLLAWAETELVALMCAEREPARCHRQFLADRLVVVHRARVVHLIDASLRIAHRPHPSVSQREGRLIYAGPVQLPLV